MLGEIIVCVECHGQVEWGLSKKSHSTWRGPQPAPTSNGKVEWESRMGNNGPSRMGTAGPIHRSRFQVGGGKYSQNSTNCFLTMSNSNETWVISASVAEAEITKSHFVILRRSPSPHVCFGSGGKFEFVALGFRFWAQRSQKGRHGLCALGESAGKRFNST